jgi:transcription elongation factor Elf1
MEINEHFFDCPYCFSQISMILEVMSEKQEYIEDCEVCCRPIVVEFSGLEGGGLDFQAKSTND